MAKGTHWASTLACLENARLLQPHGTGGQEAVLCAVQSVGFHGGGRQKSSDPVILAVS